MFTTLTLGALAIVAGVQDTDTTFAASGARALELSNAGGQVVVRVWDRDEVRVQADHSRRTYIEIDRSSDGVIEIEPDAEMGPATVVDFQITIPREMSVYLEGMYSDLDVDGVRGEVEVETLEGQIVLRNITGDIQAEAVAGEIRIESVEGDVEVSSVAKGVRLDGVSGEIMVESVSGSIEMANIRSDRVEAGTVSGRIIYSGSITEGGRYYFGAHSGQIVLALPDGVNAQVTAMSLTGTFVGRYPGVPESLTSRKRNSFTLGSGGAEIELETFGGGIVIRRQGSPESEMEMAWTERDGAGHWTVGTHAGALAAAESAIEISMDALHDFEIDLSGLEGLEAMEGFEGMGHISGLEALKGLHVTIDESVLREIEALGPRITEEMHRALEEVRRQKHR
jgi:DUF4097 and DUF4098 domain-containing protein YvlB